MTSYQRRASVLNPLPLDGDEYVFTGREFIGDAKDEANDDANLFVAPNYVAPGATVDPAYKFKLNQDAEAVYIDWRDEINRVVERYGAEGNETMQSYWRKSTTTALKIAALLRLFDWADDEPNAKSETGEPKERIDASTFRRAFVRRLTSSNGKLSKGLRSWKPKRANQPNRRRFKRASRFSTARAKEKRSTRI